MCPGNGTGSWKNSEDRALIIGGAGEGMETETRYVTRRTSDQMDRTESWERGQQEQDEPQERHTQVGRSLGPRWIWGV